jgi:hypothetical protein
VLQKQKEVVSLGLRKANSVLHMQNSIIQYKILLFRAFLSI